MLFNELRNAMLHTYEHQSSENNFKMFLKDYFRSQTQRESKVERKEKTPLSLSGSPDGGDSQCQPVPAQAKATSQELHQGFCHGWQGPRHLYIFSCFSLTIAERWKWSSQGTYWPHFILQIAAISTIIIQYFQSAWAPALGSAQPGSFRV